MSAQKIATGLALGALTGLFLWVGMPALLPHPTVAEIDMTVPVAEVVEGSPRNEVAPADTPEPVPPASGRTDDDDLGDDDADDDAGEGDDDAPRTRSGSDDDSDDDDDGDDDDGDDDGDDDDGDDD